MSTSNLGSIVSNTFSQIREGVLAHDNVLNKKEIGFVMRISSGIVQVSGLPNVGFEELLKFPNELYGIAFNVDEDEVCLLYTSPSPRD